MLSRAMLLLLLLMNLGVAAWWWLRTPPAAETPAGGEPGVPTLQLLSEVDAAADGSGQVSAAQGDLDLPEDAGQNLECQQLGPFLTQADLRRAMKALAPQVSRMQFRETRALANRGFWVYLPAQGTREAALASARELSARGVRDYYVVTAGDQENTISLGLFRDLVNAERRRDEVTGLGFTPELNTRTEEIPNYWIELAIAPGFDWSTALKGYNAVESSPINCG